MKKTLILMFALLVGSSLLYGLNEDIVDAGCNDLFTITANSDQTLSLRFDIGAFTIEDVEADGQTYQMILDEKGAMLEEEGMPSLPSYSTMIAIPGTGSVECNVTSRQTRIIENIRVYPSQGVNLSGETRGFIRNDQFYNSTETWPVDPVIHSEPGIMRNYRVITLTIQPFSWNAGLQSLSVNEEIEVDLTWTPEQGENELSRHLPFSRSFEPLYRSVILNWEQVRPDEPDYQNRSILILYPNTAIAETHAQLLHNWKRTKGFTVTTVNTQTMNNATQLRNYIIDAYNNWDDPPEYIILFADANGSNMIPPHYENNSTYNGETDHPYTQLAGNDMLPEAFIGRLSCGTGADYQTVWSKIVNYEIMPYMDDTAWYQHSLLVSDIDQSGISPSFTNHFVKESILWFDPEHTFNEIIAYSPQPYLVTSGLNDGCLVFSYRGIGGMTGWGTDDIADLTNTFQLTNGVVLTCDTGSFAGYSPSRTEAFLRHGTSSAPRGGISCIGMATNGTHTPWNNCLAGGIFQGLYRDGMTTMGEALMRGKLNLYVTYNNSNNYQMQNFSYWCNLMGDPSLDVWKTLPKPLVVTAEETINAGTNFIDVTVTRENGNPIPDAWVTIRKTLSSGTETFFTTGYTDSDGTIRQFLATDLDGDCDLTVTTPGFIPYLGELTIDPQGIASVSAVVLDDDNTGDSSGNADGTANPGETLELGIHLENHNDTAASGISATLSTTDPWCTILNDTSTWPNLAPGGDAVVDDALLVAIGSGCPDRYDIVFDLAVTSSLGTHLSSFVIEVAGNDLDLSDVSVVDGQDGNLDPGENAQIDLTILNDGEVEIPEVWGNLRCVNNVIAVGDTLAWFGTIAVDGTASCTNDPFQVVAPMNLIPGMTARMELELFNSQGYSERIDFEISIGTTSIGDPIGPDAGGYFCYDEGDVGYEHRPIYDWIEIDTSEGGPGTNLNFTDFGEDQDEATTVNLPFGFPFYGIEYDEITICTNGWISFGETDMATFRNWRIPGPLGPSPMIAVFWDDLVQNYSSGDVFTWHDETDNLFVIEWSNMSNRYDNSQETFELILYDPAWHETSNGNGLFKMQYETFNNVNQGNQSIYYPTHGNYCSVGIEDHTGHTGLEYTFNNTYPNGALPLSNQSALMFAPAPMATQETHLTMGSISVDNAPFNGLLEHGEEVEFSISVVNVGTLDASQVSATISTTSDWVTISQGTVNYGDLGPGESNPGNGTFRIALNNWCPDSESLPFTMQITSAEDNREYTFTFTCQAPALDITQWFIHDQNDDGVVQPGESIDIGFTMFNEGQLPANDITCHLFSGDPMITVTDAIADHWLLEPEHSWTFASTFSIEVDESCPVVYSLPLYVVLNETGGTYFVVPLNLAVGWSDDMEGDVSGWSHYALEGTLDQWHSSNFRYHSYSHSWKAGTYGSGDYANELLCALETPELELSENTWLTFWHWMDSEDSPSTPGYGYDGGIVQIFDGNTWEYIEPQGGYPMLSMGENNPPFPQGTGFYCGAFDWQQAFFDLSDYSGVVRVRFVFGTDAGYRREGWYIDDVALTTENAARPAPTGLMASMAAGGGFDLQWQPLQEEGLTAYRVYRRTGFDDPYLPIGDTGDGDTFYYDNTEPQDSVHYYVVTALYGTVESRFSNLAQVYTGYVHSGGEPVPPFVTELQVNYPNPFNPETTIGFSLKEQCSITLDIYNIRGQRVKRLLRESLPAGQHRIVWDSRDDMGHPVSSGVYLYRMRAGGVEQTRKMLLLK